MDSIEEHSSTRDGKALLFSANTQEDHRSASS
jgi:hypothetical protein